MAIPNRFWPLDLSVESLVLREILPIHSTAGISHLAIFASFSRFASHMASGGT
jgi:hypothetical protein